MNTQPNAKNGSPVLSRLVSFCLIYFSVAVIAVSSAQTSPPQVRKAAPPAKQPPESDRGREVFGKSCLSCHGMKETSIQKKKSEQWRESVYSMVSRGAQVQPAEIEPLVSYLAANYGPGFPGMGAGEGSPHRGTATGTLPPGEARAVLVERCNTCHSLELVAANHKTKDEWNITIDRMIGLGAKLNIEQQSKLVDYLSANFGAKENPK